MIWDPTWTVVEEDVEKTVFLFPNPVGRGQTLHLSGNTNAFDAVVLCDLCGHTLFKATGHPVGEFVVSLPADLARGCYIVKLMNGDSVLRYEKLLVK